MIDGGGDRKIVREVGDGGIERWKDVVRWWEISGSMGICMRGHERWVWECDGVKLSLKRSIWGPNTQWTWRDPFHFSFICGLKNWWIKPEKCLKKQRNMRMSSNVKQTIKTQLNCPWVKNGEAWNEITLTKPKSTHKRCKVITWKRDERSMMT